MIFLDVIYPQLVIWHVVSTIGILYFETESVWYMLAALLSSAMAAYNVIGHIFNFHGPSWQPACFIGRMTLAICMLSYNSISASEWALLWMFLNLIGIMLDLTGLVLMELHKFIQDQEKRNNNNNKLMRHIRAANFDVIVKYLSDHGNHASSTNNWLRKHPVDYAIECYLATPSQATENITQLMLNAGANNTAYIRAAIVILNNGKENCVKFVESILRQRPNMKIEDTDIRRFMVHEMLATYLREHEYVPKCRKLRLRLYPDRDPGTIKVCKKECCKKSNF